MTGRHADRRPSLMQIAAAIVGTAAATQVIPTSPRDTCGHDQVVMWSGVRWVHPMDMGVCDRPPASSDD